MPLTEVEMEAEQLVNLHQTIRESAKVVYDFTEKFVDDVPDERRSLVADRYVDYGYDELRRADKLIEIGRVLLSLKPNHLKSYPSYPRVKGFWSHLERCSGEQKKRLDHHLRFVCLKDSGELLPRRNAAEVVIDALLDVYKLRDMLFYRLDVNGVTQELSDGDIRVLDGVIESSIDFVECIAGVVRKSTQVAPRR